MLANLITGLYSIFGAAMALSYIPQVLAAWREKGRAEAISLPAWTFWTANAGVATVYALFIVRDPVISLASAVGFVGCSATTSIVFLKRVRSRRDEQAAPQVQAELPESKAL